MTNSSEASVPIDALVLANTYYGGIVDQRNQRFEIIQPRLLHLMGFDRNYVRPLSDLSGDPRKDMFVHGLGNLGLGSVQSLEAMQPEDQSDYAGLIVDFGDQILGLSGRLLTHDEGTFKLIAANLGADMNGNWAREYSTELIRFNEILRSTELWQAAVERDKNSSDEIIQDRRADLDRLDWHVRRVMANGQFVLARFPVEQLVNQL